MSYIGQAPGLGQRSVFRFVAAQGQTQFSGRDATGLVLAYARGPSTIVTVKGRILSAPEYTATDGSTLTIAVPLSAGDEVLVLSDAPFSPADTYTRDAADARFTRKRNRIVNPGVRISQERGADVVTLPPASPPVYVVDGWQCFSSQSATMTVARVAGPAAGTYRLAVTVTNGAPMSGSDSSVLVTKIEGADVADLKWGTTGAKSIVLRFLVTAPAGTYHVSIRNNLNNRSFPASYTIQPNEANIEKLMAVTIPGDTLGSWATDNTLGLSVSFVLATTQVGTANIWQNGSIHGAAQTNITTTTGSVFKIGEVGLYEGVYTPPFEMTSFNEDLLKCQRYYEKSYSSNLNPGTINREGVIGLYTVGSPGQMGGAYYGRFAVPKRIVPTIGIYSPTTGASGKGYDFVNTADVTLSADLIGMSGFRLFNNSLPPATATLFEAHYVADARL